MERNNDPWIYTEELDFEISKLLIKNFFACGWLINIHRQANDGHNHMLVW